MNDMRDPNKILIEDSLKLDFLKRTAHIANMPYCYDLNAIGRDDKIDVDENGKDEVNADYEKDELENRFQGDAVIDEVSFDVVVFFREPITFGKISFGFTKWGNDQAMVEKNWYSVINKPIIWTKTVDVIAEKLSNITKNEINIIFTGHGVGGVYAILLAMKIVTNQSLLFELKKKSRKYNLKFKVVTFGQPRVGNLPFARLVNGALEVYRVTNENDPFVHLPKKTKGQRFGHHEREYWITENNCECRTLALETDTFKLYECPGFIGDISLYADESTECSLSADTSLEDAQLAHWGPYLGTRFANCRQFYPLPS
ncbi:hypothetical protein G9A89_021477 [Geosiphon pyriformis]|nr:hypothetical protein G9A89_021477 [Geosiphon pyriformis]